MRAMQKAKARPVTDLVKEFVALELEMTDCVPAECLRLHRQHLICIELTARTAWTEAGPQIDAEIERIRASVRARQVRTPQMESVTRPARGRRGRDRASLPA